MSRGGGSTLRYGMEVDGVTLLTADINQTKLSPGVCYHMFLFGGHSCSLV